MEKNKKDKKEERKEETIAISKDYAEALQVGIVEFYLYALLDNVENTLQSLMTVAVNMNSKEEVDEILKYSREIAKKISDYAGQEIEKEADRILSDVVAAEPIKPIVISLPLLQATLDAIHLIKEKTGKIGELRLQIALKTYKSVGGEEEFRKRIELMFGAPPTDYVR